MSTQSDYGADDPIWVDDAWLDTVVVVGLTCFVLCLMKLSKVCHPTADDEFVGSRLKHSSNSC
jgi:hypothetical protein